MPNLELRRCCECEELTLFASKGKTINAACRSCIEDDPLLGVMEQRLEDDHER